MMDQVPFRETHHVAGAAVKMAEDKACTMKDLTLSDFKSLHPAFESDVTGVWDFEKSIENRASIGGTSRAAVQGQIDELKKWLSAV
jgi:argininosuccinate lyase